MKSAASSGRDRDRTGVTRILSWLRTEAAGVLMILAVTMGSTAVQAQDKPIQLKISLWVPPAHPLFPATKEWTDSIGRASGGSIKSVIFPSEQLGKAFDHYDMARDGIADVAYVSPGYQPGRFPIINAAQMPFTIANGRDGTAAVDAWYRKYAAAEMKDTHFCLAFVHDPGSLHPPRKLVIPAESMGLTLHPP